MRARSTLPLLCSLAIISVDPPALARSSLYRGRAPRPGRSGLQEFLETARIPKRYHDCEFENFAAYGPHQLSLQGARTRAGRFAI